jgi:hypothetical protein
LPFGLLGLLAVASVQVTAQSTPALVGSLLTTAVNWRPVAFPTAMEVLEGVGFRAIEIEDCVVVDEELPPQATRNRRAPSINDVIIRFVAATAGLLR